MSAPSISILLPTWNGADTLAELLPSLRAQRNVGPIEILAHDSGSTDGTQDLLTEHGVQWKPIDRATFSHGGTRNRIAAEARGELFVFMSQDVVPRDHDFLAALVAPFADPELAGACARILPFPDSDPLTARTVLDLPEAVAASSQRRLDCPVWQVDALTRADYLRFNNVASAIRADVFRRFPFPEVAFGEDFAWAARVLTAGFVLGHVGDSVVYHAHRYTPREAYARYSTDAAFHKAAHGWNMRPTLFSVLRGLAYELREDLAFVRKRGGIGALLRAPALRGAQVLGQYMGARRELVLDPNHTLPGRAKGDLASLRGAKSIK